MLTALGDDLLAEIHLRTYDFYRAQFDCSENLSNQFDAYREAAFHCTQSPDVDSEWLGNVADYLFEHGYAQPLREVIAELRPNVERRVDSASFRALLQFMDARVSRWAGRVQQARDELESIDTRLLPAFQARIGLEFAHACREAGATLTAADAYRALRTTNASDAATVRTLAGVWEGDILLVQGQFASAYGVLEEVKSRAEHEGLGLVAAEAVRLLGHVNRFCGRAEESLRQYDEAEARFRTLDNLPGIAAIATNRIELWALWHPEQAVRTAPEAITVNQGVNRRLEIGKCQTAVAQALLALGSEGAALHELDQAIQLLEEVGYRSGRARALLTRAFAHSQLQDSETAAKDLELAVTELCTTDVYPTLVVQAEFLATHLGLDLPLVKIAAERARRSIQPLTNFADLERHLEGTVNSLLRIGASG